MAAKAVRGRVHKLARRIVAAGLGDRIHQLGGTSKLALTSSERVTLGRHCFMHAEGAWVVDYGSAIPTRIRIGNFTALAREVQFLAVANHHLDSVSAGTHQSLTGRPETEDWDYLSQMGDINVGSACVLSHGAKVLAGVTIGNGAIVGSAAVVAKDVRPFAIVAGNPAREIRRRFTDEQVEALELIAWWDWPDELVIQRVADLRSRDVDSFIARYLPEAGF